MTHIDDLPSEILKEIIHHLPQRDLYTCNLINKRFFNTANSLLWATPQTYAAHEFMQGLVGAHHPVGHYIRSTKWLYFQWNDEYLFQFLQHATYVEEFSLSLTAHFNNNTLLQLLCSCPRITTLLLRTSNIKKNCIVAMGRHCHRLTSLTLDVFGYVLTDGFFSSLVNCPLLEHLQLDRFRWMAGDRGGNDMRSDLASLHGLKSLTLFSDLTSFSGFDGTLLLDINHWPNLESLRLRPCRSLEDTVVINFIKSHRHLKRLDVIGGKYKKFVATFGSTVTNATLDAIITYLPNIEQMDLSNSPRVTHKAIYRLIQKCPRLNRLKLENCGIKKKHFPNVFKYDSTRDPTDDPTDDYYKDMTHLNYWYKEMIDSVRQQ